MLVWRKIVIALVILSLTGAASACINEERSFASRSGQNNYPIITERPVMDHLYETTNFLIHYNTIGDSAVYHPDEDIDPEDGTPDYVNRVGEFFEAAHCVYIDELGYDKPPPDDSNLEENKYDVYITTLKGLTTPEHLSNYYQDGREAWTSYIQVGCDMTTENHPENPYPFLQATCAHEYFHAVQMAYRAFPNDEKAWFYELTAMWAEERVFDDLNELFYTLEDYYFDIDKSIYLNGGLHMYGAWVWAEYLSQNHSNEIIKRVFERLKYNRNSINSLILALGDAGLDINTEFTIYSGWNYFTGINYHDGFFEEGFNFPVTVPIDNSHIDYPVNWQHPEEIMENLGISYTYFENPGINKGDLIITAEADVRYAEGVCAAGIYTDGRDIDLQFFKLSAGESVDIRIEDFDECAGAIMATNWSYFDSSTYGSADYRYKAVIDSVVVDIKTETEPVIAKGFTAIGNYPNPFNLSTEITFYWNLNPSYYTIAIYDITGRKVDSITGNAVAGENRVNWRANENLVSGIYFYRIDAGHFSETGRMMLIK